MLIYKIKRNEIKKQIILKTNRIPLQNEERIDTIMLHNSFLLEHITKEKQVIFETECQNIYAYSYDNDYQKCFLILENENSSIVYNPITRKIFYFPKIKFQKITKNREKQYLTGTFSLQIGTKTDIITLFINIETLNVEIIESEKNPTTLNITYENEENSEQNKKIFLENLKQNFAFPLMSDRAKKRLK